MQQANGWLKLNQFGSNVPLTAITPAEAVVLQKAHERNAGGPPLQNLVVVVDLPITVSVELSRLRQKYGVKFVDFLYPGNLPTLPQTFKEAGFAVDEGAMAPKLAEPIPKVAEPTKK